MKKIFTLISAIIFSANVFSQPSIQWQKCLGGTLDEFANFIHQTSDGGYIVSGHTQSNNGDVTGNHGNRDFWLVQLDSTGNLQWQKCLGGTYDDGPSYARQTADGGYIVAGTAFSDDGDVIGNHGIYDFWLLKTDANGNLQWQKCLGGASADNAYSFEETSDGGYIMAGSTNSNDGDVSGNHSGQDDYWVVKLDSSRTIQWQKCLGGTGQDEAYSVQQTLDNGYIVAGKTNSNNGDVSGNHGNNDYWIVKLNSGGAIQWQKCLGGTNNEIARSILQTLDGGYIVSGESGSNDGDVSGNHGSADFWIVKLDGNGTLQWQKCLGGTGAELANSIQKTLDGGYVLTGFSSSNDGDVTNNHGSIDYWIVKLDNAGLIQWQNCIGGTTDDLASWILQTSDGGYIVAGSTYSNDGDASGNHGSSDYWIVKLAPFVGIEENNLFSQINIYPNPVKDELTVRSSELGDKKIELVEIYDMMGKVRLTLDVRRWTTKNQTTIDVSQLTPGIYFVVITDGKNIVRGKFVKV